MSDVSDTDPKLASASRPTGASPSDQQPVSAPPSDSRADGVLPSDWPAKAADTIESAVGAVHDRVVRPLYLVARGLVFGILIGTMLFTIIVLVSVALVRLLDSYVFPGRVWASEALVGALLVALGILGWSFGRARQGTEGG
jgi:hypothetical protein